MTAIFPLIKTSHEGGGPPSMAGVVLLYLISLTQLATISHNTTHRIRLDTCISFLEVSTHVLQSFEEDNQVYCSWYGVQLCPAVFLNIVSVQHLGSILAGWPQYCSTFLIHVVYSWLQSSCCFSVHIEIKEDAGINDALLKE